MKTNGNPPALKRFFSNPLVGIIGSIASVASLLLAVYFYLQSERHRELTYMVYPTKTIVLKAGQTSRLSVTLDNKRFDNDLTAAQIAFWNSGNEPIRRDQVLKPFVIRTSRGVPIIEARLLKKSRDVIDITALRTSAGEIALSWNILEQNDGGLIQIVFAGGSDTPISASVVVEGQPQIKEVEPSTTLNVTLTNLLGGINIGLGILFLSIGLFRILLIRLRHREIGWTWSEKFSSLSILLC